MRRSQLSALRAFGAAVALGACSTSGQHAADGSAADASAASIDGGGRDVPPSPLDGGARDVAAPVDGASSCRRASATAPGEVLIATGVVRGAAVGNSYSYKGIPYLAPPVGPLRFAPPAPAACWTDVRDATAFGAICPQWDQQNTTVLGAEDCLSLNVWTPSDATSASRLPVMVFIHGGGHQQGSSSVTDNGNLVYDGQPLVETEHVVLVTFNYRLGPFGYLANAALAAADPNGSTGNLGTRDQLAALRWVKDNIGAFGGDPSKVMIFGESAGGEAVCTLLASPLASGLFAAAASESGPCDALTLGKAETYGDTVVASIGCAAATDVAACLRAQTVAAFMQTVPAAQIGALPYNAVVDGYVLPNLPPAQIAAGLQNKVPVILGTNRDEMGAQVPAIPDENAYEQAVATFAASVGQPALAAQILTAYPAASYPSPRAAYVALLTDAYFACPARANARTLATHQSQPVYRYLFTHVPDNATALQTAIGVVHAAELPFVFGSLPSPGAGDLKVIAQFAGYWSRLATSGDPNGGGLATWPVVAATSDVLLEIDTTPAIVTSYRATQCDFWVSTNLVDAG